MKKKRAHVNEEYPSNLWDGWYVDGEVLVDGGGNFYRQSEIRAIFYTRQLLKSLREQIDFLKPRPLSEPIQLSLPGVGSFFDHAHDKPHVTPNKVRSNELCV